MSKQKQNCSKPLNAQAYVSYLSERFNLNDEPVLVLGKRHYRHIMGRHTTDHGCDHCYKKAGVVIRNLRSANPRRYEVFQRNLELFRKRITSES